jgi:hypothetical protein
MKRPIKRRPYRKDLSPLQPVKTPRDLRYDIGQLRHEVIELRAENDRLRPAKAAVAALRAQFVDFLYVNSVPNGNGAGALTEATK